MILIHSVTLINFRGAKRLSLSLEKKNFAIRGANGTGKSGVVDAIEFGLTGNITRLSGKGAGGLSIKAHGPHVDSRKAPAEAKVILVVHFPLLGKTATIERSVAAPKTPSVSLPDSDVAEVLKKLEDHPEFALSRREILKYVLTEPGERAKSVQALLRLDALETTRAGAQTVFNQCKTALKSAEADAKLSQTSLMTALGIEELKVERILEAANARRTLLGLSRLTDLPKDSSLKEGLVPGLNAAKKISINKAIAHRDLDAFEELLTLPKSREVVDAFAQARKVGDELAGNQEIQESFKKQEFVKRGYQLVERDMCPLCENAWDRQQLKKLLETRLAEAKTAQQLHTRLTDAARVVGVNAAQIVRVVRTVTSHAQLLGKAESAANLSAWADQLETLQKRLMSFQDVESYARTIESGLDAPALVGSTIEVLRQEINGIPDASREDDARDYLVLCQERLDVFRKAARKKKMWEHRVQRSGKLLEHFTVSTNEVLTTVYKKIEVDFSRFYQQINRDDEPAFSGRLLPEKGRLDFEVDFFNRGFHPPGAYHSEGHQDGMGLCLYLALMKSTLGPEFTFCLLDDVLTSIDSGHRKEVCRLLKTEFPNTQFVLTTHEEVWLKNLLTEGVVTKKTVAQFKKWSVDLGPIVWDHKDVWEEIQADLDGSEIPGAAHSLRRYLEYVSDEICDRLRGNVQYRSDGSYDLGDLLPSVVSRLGDLVSKAEKASSSWEQDEKTQKAAALRQRLKDSVGRSQLEQWAINATVHYNRWAELQKNDFEPVVKSFKDLLACFRCTACDGFLYVSPPRGNPDTLRCDCGDVSFNLRKKGS